MLLGLGRQNKGSQNNRYDMLHTMVNNTMNLAIFLKEDKLIKNWHSFFSDIY
jgi:hypothetical protein